MANWCQQNLKGKRDKLDETFGYASDGSVVSIDTAFYAKDADGTIKLPASYTAGFTYSDKNANWVFGADLNLTTWNNYSFYDQKDAVKNSMKFHAGAQYFPAKINTAANKFWRFVKYRAGFYYGNDYVNLGQTRPDYGVTLGAALPLTSLRRFGNSEFVLFNTGIEYGQRGSKQNQSLREGVFRINFGLSISTNSWFVKRKYY